MDRSPQFLTFVKVPQPNILYQCMSTYSISIELQSKLDIPKKKSGTPPLAQGQLITNNLSGGFLVLMSRAL